MASLSKKKSAVVVLRTSYTGNGVDREKEEESGGEKASRGEKGGKESLMFKCKFP